MIERTTTTTRLDHDKNVLDKYVSAIRTIDSHDNILDETIYDRQGNIERRATYRYNSLGHQIEMVEFDNSNEVLFRETIEESVPGNMISITTVYGGVSKAIKTFKYTELGNADQAIITDENGNHEGHETMVFDDERRVIKRTEFDAEGNETFREETEYLDGPIEQIYYEYINGELDSKVEKYKSDGFVIFHKSFDGNLELTEEFKTVLNKDKEPIQYHTKDFMEGSELIQNLEYNEKGEYVYDETFQDGKRVSTQKMEYDNNGLLIYEEHIDTSFHEGAYYLVLEHSEKELNIGSPTD